MNEKGRKKQSLGNVDEGLLDRRVQNKERVMFFFFKYLGAEIHSMG